MHNWSKINCSVGIINKQSKVYISRLFLFIALSVNNPICFSNILFSMHRCDSNYNVRNMHCILYDPLPETCSLYSPGKTDFIQILFVSWKFISYPSGLLAPYCRWIFFGAGIRMIVIIMRWSLDHGPCLGKFFFPCPDPTSCQVQ